MIEAENGREAVPKTVELRPDVVILDLAMPVLDGLHAAREISQQLPQTPMLIYTMHWSPHLEVEAQKFGVRKIISKANSSLLLSSVQQLLDEILRRLRSMRPRRSRRIFFSPASLRPSSFRQNQACTLALSFPRCRGRRSFFAARSR